MCNIFPHLLRPFSAIKRNGPDYCLVLTSSCFCTKDFVHNQKYDNFNIFFYKIVYRKDELFALYIYIYVIAHYVVVRTCLSILYPYVPNQCIQSQRIQAIP